MCVKATMSNLLCERTYFINGKFSSDKSIQARSIRFFASSFRLCHSNSLFFTQHLSIIFNNHQNLLPNKWTLNYFQLILIIFKLNVCAKHFEWNKTNQLTWECGKKKKKVTQGTEIISHEIY